MPVTKIRKRDGTLVKFEPKKIEEAIRKAFIASKSKDGKQAKRLTDEVVKTVNRRWKKRMPLVEQVQDTIEEVFIKNGFPQVARIYIAYRHHRTQIREVKKLLGVKDELKLSVNAIRVLERRYLLKDDKGNVIETPRHMMRRVAKAVAKAERGSDRKKYEGEFYSSLASLEFLPNTPTLMNAGTKLGQLSACFVLPVGDSIKDIFETAKNMATVHQSGGGVGFSFSHIRPKGDIVKSTHGVASGPLSFMRVFDTATEVIKQGGKRRGANMGILSVDHPDILDFIEAKTRETQLSNFNISVGVTDKFMDAVKKDRDFNLISPRTGKIVRHLSAKAVFDLIVTMAWETGDPGMVFLSQINRHNTTPKLGKIEATNPCGELPLLPYESCNLGSINLSKMVKDKKIDWKKLAKTVHVGVRFLDNVIDVTKFPMPEVEKITKANRKIGLGVMGFADMLIELGIPYDSEKAVSTAEKLMKFISKEARIASMNLARKRGVFPNYKNSIWKKKNLKLRNATLTTVAPTGTISIIAGCSSGIEPLFAISFIRNVMEGARLLETNSAFESLARNKGFYSSELMMGIARKGSVADIKRIPKNIRKLFVTAFDISPKKHVRMQAAFQKYTDNSVSKTINFPSDATVDDVKEAFLLAYQLKCKGITVFRYGSKKEQVLYLADTQAPTEQLPYVSAASEYSGGCPTSLCPF